MGREYLAGINGPPDPAWAGLTLAGYRSLLDRRTRVNTAHLLPHGTLRYDVAGPVPTPDRDESRRLLRLVETGLAEGACGLSTGLDYAPGMHGAMDEFAAIGALLAEAGRPYVSHMRGYEAQAWLGMSEVRQIAEHSGAAVHISHLHGPANLLLGMVEDARGAGLDMTFDSYPYLRGFSLLAVPLLPKDLLALSTADLIGRLADPAVADRLVDEWSAIRPNVYDRAVIANAPHDDYRDYEGLSITDAAERTGTEPGEFVIEILHATNAAVTAVFQQPPTNTDDDVRALLRHEAHMAGSDGIFIGSRPHPRAYGTFSRFLARHVRGLGDWTWAQAAVHLAGHPARRYGLARRGILRPGYAADVVVVDPVGVRDIATYDDPRRLAEGISAVWVNGERVLAGGRLSPAGAGVPLSGRALTWSDH